MKFWTLVLFVQLLILGSGFGLMGEAFLDVTILDAPVVNLLLWTGLITLAGMAANAADRSLHCQVTRLLMVIAVAWFPVSLMIFGNAYFSGTTNFLWQFWVVGTAGLVLGSLLSLTASAATGLFRRWSRR